MNAKLWNWRLWVGFAASLAALLVYLLGFQKAREIFWASVALFVLAGWLLVTGLMRALKQSQSYRGKIAGPMLTLSSVLVAGVFVLLSYAVSKSFPAAYNAPKVGQKAPHFTLSDSTGKTISLAQLLAEPIANASGVAQPPKGVLLVFYRGYW
jgi:hypothetical protein